MVVLLVKGTKEHDEFLFTVSQKEIVRDVTKKVAHLQNLRLVLKHQLHSARELCEGPTLDLGSEALSIPKIDGSERIHYEGGEVDCTPLREMIELGTSVLASNRLHADACDTEDAAERLRRTVQQLWPRYCTNASGNGEAVVPELYRMHDDPDIDEDLRLRVYHWRALLDPLYRSHEHTDEDTCVAWFAGKAMDGDHSLEHYTKGNDKSKLTIKLTGAESDAPQREPRIQYDVQRSLRQSALQRSEQLKTLEASELSSKVRELARGQVLLPSMQGSSSLPGIKKGQEFRPIFPQKHETDVTLPTSE